MQSSLPLPLLISRIGKYKRLPLEASGDWRLRQERFLGRARRVLLHFRYSQTLVKVVNATGILVSPR
jgi:hypothetical protein